MPLVIIRFEKKYLKRICEPKRGAVTWGWRKFLDKLHNFPSSNIIWVIKWRWLSLAGHMRNAYEILRETLKRYHLEDVDVYGRIILKFIKEIWWECMDWSHLSQKRGASGALLRMRHFTLVSLYFLITWETCYVAITSPQCFLVSCTPFILYRIYDPTRIEGSLCFRMQRNVNGCSYKFSTILTFRNLVSYI